MTTQSAAALLDAAIFTMERARAELGAGPVPSSAEAPATQTALSRFVRRFDVLDASDYTPAQQASAYEDTAGVLRRRAARGGVSDEALVEAEQRALYFEARARHKRTGEPMPYALRTNNERLGYVDAFRRELVDLVDVVQLIASDEIGAFVDALERSDGADAPNARFVATVFDAFVADVGELLGVLGVYRDEQRIQVTPYRKASPGPAAPPMDPEDPAATHARVARKVDAAAAEPATSNGIATPEG